MYKHTTFLFTIFVVFITCSITLAQIEVNQPSSWKPPKVKEEVKEFGMTGKTIDFQENLEEKYRKITEVGRTFGVLRRMKIAIPAIMYKLGVVTTMLGFLTLFTLKGLAIGIALLVINLSSAFAKLHLYKQEHGDEHHKIPQSIHVHVHGNQPGHYISHGHGHHTSESHSPWSWADRKTQLLSNPLTSSSRIDDDFYYYNKYKELRDSLYAQEVQ